MYSWPSHASGCVALSIMIIAWRLPVAETKEVLAEALYSMLVQLNSDVTTLSASLILLFRALADRLRDKHVTAPHNCPAIKVSDRKSQLLHLLKCVASAIRNHIALIKSMYEGSLVSPCHGPSITFLRFPQLIATGLRRSLLDMDFVTSQLGVPLMEDSEKTVNLLADCIYHVLTAESYGGSRDIKSSQS